MNYTYHDLNIYQYRLKELFKMFEPDIYLCYLMEESNPITLTSTGATPMRKLANLLIGIRGYGPNCYKAAEIYSNGHIVNNGLPDTLYNPLVYWLCGDLIKSEKYRAEERIAIIKDELLATVYHPDNIKRLIDLPQHLK